MTPGDTFLLTARELAPMIREAVKDKRYRASALGQLVGRYIRWFRNEYGATPSSIKDYESILARMAITLADKDPLEITVDDLREVIDLWADREPRTRQKVTSVIRAFWAWAEDESFVPISPATRIRRPRAPRKLPALLPRNTDARTIAAARTARDRLALMILFDAGVRRAELAGIRVRDIDLGRRTLVVTGKGQKDRIIPLRGRVVLAAEEYLLEELEGLDRRPEPDDYLLYPELRTPPHPTTGERRVYRADPKRPHRHNGIHRWWYRQLEQAGIVAKGTQGGLNMHRARHTFATDVRRAHRDVGTVQHLLGHSDSSTTTRLYGHYDQDDLERAIEELAREREGRE